MADSHRLRSTLAAAPVLLVLAVFTEAKNRTSATPMFIGHICCCRLSCMLHASTLFMTRLLSIYSCGIIACVLYSQLAARENRVKKFPAMPFPHLTTCDIRCALCTSEQRLHDHGIHTFYKYPLCSPYALVHSKAWLAAHVLLLLARMPHPVRARRSRFLCATLVAASIIPCTLSVHVISIKHVVPAVAVAVAVAP
jgi:hypothetical protein